MHELGVVRSIVDIVVNHAESAQASRVNRVDLVIGKTRNLEQYWVQEYFDRCSKGTVAEGAHVEIEYVPIEFACRECGAHFGYKHTAAGAARCECCGSANAELLSGAELSIASIEIE